MAGRFIIFAVGLAGLAACSGGAGTEPAPGAVASVDPLAAARAAYGVTARRPADFYAETDPYPDRLTLTAHVRALDVDPDAASNAELCTNDVAAASNWFVQTANGYSDRAQQTGGRETEWFIEREYDLATVPDSMLRLRVFQCTAVDRAVDGNDIVARVNLPTIGADSLKFVVEYLFTFSAENNALNAIVASSADSAAGDPGHTLVRVHVRKFQGAGGCDRLELWQDTYVYSFADRLLRRRSTMIDTFAARVVGGDAELCD